MIGVTGGRHKAWAILGALHGGFLDALVTNELVALRLLQLERELPVRLAARPAAPACSPFGEESPLGLAIPPSPRSYCQRANVHHLSECSRKGVSPVVALRIRPTGGSAGLMYPPSPSPAVALVTLDRADGGAW